MLIVIHDIYIRVVGVRLEKEASGKEKQTLDRQS